MFGLRGSSGTGDLDRICSEATGIPELKKTTRDEPDYDKLMNCQTWNFERAWTWA